MSPIGGERIGDKLVNGRWREMSDREIAGIRAGIGMVFQRFNLFPHLTALENVMLGPTHVLKRSRAEAEPLARGLLRKVGLEHKAADYPERLSGGQQQRVAIARSLAMQPRLMLFDEATSALDPELIGEVLNVMRGLARDGMTMLIVTHEMRFAEDVADRVVFMDHGRIVEEGEPHRLFRSPSHPRTQAFLNAVVDRRGDDRGAGLVSAWLTVWGLLPVLLGGAVITVEITAGAFVLATLIGVTFAILQRLEWRPLRVAIATYVDVFRAVPVLTQLFIIYFGLTEIGIRLDPLPSAIVGFGINGGAYLTEVFRAGIESVHHGQMEAAQMLGMTRLAALRIVILPQAVRVVLPPLGNYAIGLLKDTALASAVAAPELMFRARTLVDKTFLATQIFVTAGAIYLAMSLPLGYLTRRAEARLSRGRR